MQRAVLAIFKAESLNFDLSGSNMVAVIVKICLRLLLFCKQRVESIFLCLRLLFACVRLLGCRFLRFGISAGRKHIGIAELLICGDVGVGGDCVKVFDKLLCVDFLLGRLLLRIVISSGIQQILRTVFGLLRSGIFIGIQQIVQSLLLSLLLFC